MPQDRHNEIVNNIKGGQESLTRYELDLYLLQSGYGPEEIEAAWKTVNYRKPVRPSWWAGLVYPLQVVLTTLAPFQLFLPFYRYNGKTFNAFGYLYIDRIPGINEIEIFRPTLLVSGLFVVLSIGLVLNLIGLCLKFASTPSRPARHLKVLEPNYFVCVTAIILNGILNIITATAITTGYSGLPFIILNFIILFILLEAHTVKEGLTRNKLEVEQRGAMW